MAQTIEAILYQGPAICRDYTPGGAVDAGSIREREDGTVGVAVNDIAAGELGAEQISGVFKVVCASKTFAKGDPVYWDASADTALTADDTIESGDFYIGTADAAATTSDGNVLVDLNAQRPDLAGVSS
jgi:predicted RecA/RadA family phage recombinase